MVGQFPAIKIAATKLESRELEAHGSESTVDNAGAFQLQNDFPMSRECRHVKKESPEML